MSYNKMRKTSTRWLVVFLVWLIINLRVAAGAATSFERAIDGLVGGILLLTVIYYTMRFFNFFGLSGDDGDSSGSK